MNEYMHVCMYVHRNMVVYISACTPVHTYVCMHAFTYIYIYIHIHMYMYISIDGEKFLRAQEILVFVVD